MTVTKFTDYPFKDVVATAYRKVQEGWTIHQKFTCENCGTRQTMEEPDKFFEKGICEECNHVTDLVARGCNYTAIYSTK